MEVQNKSEANKISLFAAIIININIMIGAGIYINPPVMAQKAGGLSFLGWALSSLIFLPLVLCVSKAAKLFPGEGSFHSYVKNGLGETTGFLAGWAYFLTYASTIAIQAYSFKEMLLLKFDLPLINAYPIIFNLIFFTCIYLLSLFSLKIISRIQSFATIAKLLPVFILFFFLIFFLLKGKLVGLASIQTSGFSLSDLQFTLPLAIFGFWGFESCCSISHLIKGGEKNASRAIFLGFFTTILIYTTFNYGLIQMMGAKNLETFGTSGFINFLQITSPLVLSLLGIIITTSIFMAYTGTAYGIVNATSFNLNAMAKQKIIFFPKFLSKMSHNQRPHTSIFAQLLLAFGFLTLMNKKVVLIALTNLGLIFTLIITSVSIFVILLNKKSYRAILIPVLAFISCLILGYYSWLEVGNVLNVIPFLILLLIGLISYKIQTKKSCPLKECN